VEGLDFAESEDAEADCGVSSKKGWWKEMLRDFQWHSGFVGLLDYWDYWGSGGASQMSSFDLVKVIEAGERTPSQQSLWWDLECGSVEA
jgi:hypothetical protein